MDQQVAKLRSLLEASRTISSGLRLDRVLEEVINRGMHALAAEAGTIWLLDRTHDRVLPVVALGPKGEKIKGLWLRPGEGVAGAVLLEKESLLVEDVAKAPQWAARFDNSSGFHTRSILCVPLVYRDRAIGVLQFVNKRENSLFGPDDVALAETLASQAAVAIENSRILEDQIIKAHEDERRRIARDIHDGPAQTLASLVLRADICRKMLDANPAHVRAELEDLKECLAESLQEVRRIIFDLRPLALDQLGLAGALKVYLDGVSNRTNLAPVLIVEGEERDLPPSIEVTLYRLIQEAVNNARKHAHAATVNVRLEYHPDRVAATVDDDGLGFDVDQAANREGDHFGLMGIRERVNLLEGTLDISSRRGQGTHIAFSFPVTGRLKDDRRDGKTRKVG